ncbi:AMP-binding protein [Rosenbergiella collisarenosi]|uniref:AMP-binding protein n=1 Tax=Rosenbergiella collisarenosi TaxID=1544695 RepID=UPI001BDAFA7C|nr:AMP-binding protein [Rosenbergiella collisarenosi]MBT0722369.1 AMP-binding protein [Rosenbergiella collisarenosi]
MKHQQSAVLSRGTPSQQDVSRVNADNTINQRYSSLLEMFEQATTRFSQQPAFENLGASLTYHQLDKRSEALAAYLQQKLGISAGQRVGLMLPNCLQYPVAFFAIIRCGAIVVNINPLYTARELHHQVSDSGVEALIVLSNFAHTVQAVMAQSPIKHIIVSELGDEHPVIQRKLIHFSLHYVKKKVPKWQLIHHKYRDCLKQGRLLRYQRAQLTRDDIALLQYTGGTTGMAKGAMLTHGNLLANIEQIKAVYGELLIPGEERVVSALPLYHIFALMINCLLFIELGGHNRLITNPLDMDKWLKGLKNFNFSVISGVNTLYAKLVNHPSFQQLNFSALKISVAGGMAVQSDVAAQWQRLTGTPIVEGYGLTECSPLVSVNPLSITRHTGTIGIPIASTEIQLLSDDAQPVLRGEPGELCVRGPQVMKGYWRQTEETTAALDEDGWLHTGDIAQLTEQGLLKLVDRKKDIIIVSGFNVYPSEIEAVLAEHPLIVEAVAVGISHEICGETVKVVIVPKDKSLTQEQVISHCRERLTGYKIPKVIEFRDILPKNPLGKILRSTLTAAPH